MSSDLAISIGIVWLTVGAMTLLWLIDVEGRNTRGWAWVILAGPIVIAWHASPHMGPAVRHAFGNPARRSPDEIRAAIERLERELGVRREA